MGVDQKSTVRGQTDANDPMRTSVRPANPRDNPLWARHLFGDHELRVVADPVEGSGRMEGRCRPPAVQPAARVGALVGGQVNEELVGAQQVGQVRPGGQVMPASAGVIPQRRVVAALLDAVPEIERGLPQTLEARST